MAQNQSRDYNCKDEELPVICRFAAFSLKRDLADFTAFSPKFNEAYAAAFETKIAAVSEVVEPKSETLELKTITGRLYGTLDGLIDPINRLSGYIALAKANLTISAADFGITQLRKGINTRDAEGAIKSLHTVNANIAKFNVILGAQGLTEELSNLFVTAATSIAADKQRQYEIVSNRKTIVQNNVALFNGLFEQLSEICTVGKVLYKTSNTVKLQEYTFNELKKRVRRTTTPDGENPEGGDGGETPA